MPAGREIFKLFGMVGLEGVENVDKELKKIDKQARRVQRELNTMGKKFTQVGKTMTKAFTLPIAAATLGVVKLIEKGGDLNETISKTNELFGASSKEIQNWASTAATSIGQSKQQAMDAAGTFAIFGRSAGLAGKDLVKFSQENTKLASDMASFFNTKPQDAITAIGAAYRGETEPIRRYGVMLDDATMRQKAFELGLITSTKKALLPQTKVLAAQALIFEKTKAAQGDFARTSDQLANKKRILSARIENVAASLGSVFLPVALKTVNVIGSVVEKVETAVEWFRGLNTSTKKTIAGFVGIAAAAGPVVFLIGKLILATKMLIPLFVALRTGGLAAYFATLSKSVAVTAAAIGALAALGWYFYSQWETISKQLIVIWGRFKLFVVKSIVGIGDVFGRMIDSILKNIAKFSKFIPGLNKKLTAYRIATLKARAEMQKLVLAQAQNVAATRSQVKETDSFLNTVKKSIDAAKERLGLIQDTNEETKTQTQLEKEQAEAAKKQAEERLEFERNISQQINELTLSDSALLDIERQKKLDEATKLGADLLEVEKLFQLKKLELERKSIEDAAKLRDREIKEERRENRRKLSRAASIGSKVNQILNKFSDAKMTRITLAEQKEIAAIQATTMTEAQKEEAIKGIQEKTERRRMALDKARMRREKLAAIFSIAINTASAVVEALPNIPLSIAVGLIGLAEGVAVAAQPAPFEEGGLIQGSEKGILAQAGESNQDELIFPLQKGIGLIVDGIAEKLAGLEFPSFGVPSPDIGNVAAAGNSSQVSLHIGTFIGDKRGLKMLERKLDKFRTSENQRKGII